MFDDEMLTIEEVAKYLKLKPQTIYKWAQTGKIPGAKFGKEWRFRRSLIDRWIDEHIASSSPSAMKGDGGERAAPKSGSRRGGRGGERSTSKSKKAVPASDRKSRSGDAALGARRESERSGGDSESAKPPSTDSGPSKN